MSDQSPPSEHDQLGWLMGEVDRLEAELEQAWKDYEDENSRREWAEDRAQRYRDALERLRDDPSLGRLGRAAIDDALAGEGQSVSEQPPHALSFAGQKRQRDDREGVERLRAELEQARAEIDTVRDSYADLLAELEQARKERERRSSIVIDAWAKDKTSLADARAELEQARTQRNEMRAELDQARRRWYAVQRFEIEKTQRYRDALERIAFYPGKTAKIARDALDGKEQT